MIVHPDKAPCRRTYAWIQAACAKRVSTIVGAELRAIAGGSGDIAAINLSQVVSRVSCPNEALRLIALAKSTKRRAGSGGNHGE